jgi:hypothetical protein
MSRTTLFFLHHGQHPRSYLCQVRAYLISAMSNHNNDVFGFDVRSSFNHVAQKRSTGNLVQNLG